MHIFFDPQPTPVCAFATSDLGAAAAIMVTASHNPPADNGYKVYWRNAAQIIPPVEGGITDAIAQAPAANTIARMHAPDAAAAGLRRIIDDGLERRYLDALAGLAWHKPNATGLPVVHSATPVRIVYTAMHGVGHHLTVRALREAGFEGVTIVPTQTDPDGTFRTVAFPNPEEKGALDLALVQAKEVDADVVLANDPDADRLAVAVKVGGAYRTLSGNEIGVLLCHDALVHADRGGKKPLVITTIVSSTMLSRIAKDLGAEYDEVLTGFKWIANKAMEREADCYFCGGYEEAIGFSIGPIVRDKDGVGAAVRLALLVRSLKAKGQTLVDRLDELAVAHGLSNGTQWSVTMPGLDGSARIAGIMRGLRESPNAIKSLDGSPIVRRVDLAGAAIPADVVVLHTEDGARLTVRPSGTEPKIKLYLELVEKVADVAALGAARARLSEKAARITAEVKAALGV